MVSASDLKPHQVSLDVDDRPLSRSCVQKTVCLQDWWLTRPETADEEHTLGVGGVTSTSQQHRAERRFSSAPVIKTYDFFELETIDGVCVILQGFINKDRTLKNGFSSEVFNHFVMGFPPYWKEFAKCCPENVPTEECFSGAFVVHQDEKGPVEGHEEVSCNTHGSLTHHVTDAVDMGITGNIQTNSNKNDFSSEVTEDSEESNGREQIFSPRFSSGKRSRSGRLLLPSLEFWRNQTVVYDANRQIAGVKEETYVAQPSGGISEDNHTSKKKGISEDSHTSKKKGYF